MVTTDSVCDLPDSLIKEFGISVCPYYVCTEEGRFLDDLELKTDELLMHVVVRAPTGTSWHSPPGCARSAWRHSIPSISGII